MYVSLLRVMATMARITTTSRAAAMTTAVTGLRPKIADRSPDAARGSAETSSLDESVRVCALTSGLLVSVWPGAAGAGASALGRADPPMFTPMLVLLFSAGFSAGAWLVAGALLGACWAAAPPAAPSRQARNPCRANEFITNTH